MRFAGDPTLEALTYQPMVLADLAGQLFVRAVELPADGATRHLAAPDLRPAFLRLPFDEALAFWEERGGDPAILDEVLGAYRRRSAEYTDDQLDTISQTAVDEIEARCRLARMRRATRWFAAITVCPANTSRAPCCILRCGPPQP